MMYTKTLLTIFCLYSSIICYSQTEKAMNQPPELPFWDQLLLIDEVDCSRDDHGFVTNGTTEVQSILGKQCRILKPSESSHYFYYRMGQNATLEAGKAYFLEVEYPDDVDRNFIVQNRGGEYTRGIQTGKTLGDGYDPPYVQSNPESISLPHSQKYMKWRTLFWLHDHYAGLSLPRGAGSRPESPEDGFLVIICQYDVKNSPLNKGAAISAIRLYEAPDFETYKLEINYPPDDLPRRHLFFREEMADGVVDNNPPAIANPTDYFEYKARLMCFLGMNTYSKDLLEFGHNQGWDPGPYGTGWVNTPAWKDRWGNMIDMLQNYDLDVMPYYEYAGSIGPSGLGPEQRAHPLNENLPDFDYTHIEWTENVNADITDPDTYTDLEKIFEQTIVKYKDQVNFIGAWLRPRSSENPISFANAALERFRVEANDNAAITRQMIRNDKQLYDKYLDWWFLKRKDFLFGMRDYLRSEGVNEKAVVLYTSDYSESGKTHYDWGYEHNILTDDLSAFDGLSFHYPVFDLEEYIEKDWHLEAQLLPENTWGDWEWQHAAPEPDPQNYSGTEGVLMTYTFNKAYTVGSGNAFDQFRTESGLAIVRHYCLNEDGIAGTGYFLSDVEWHGPYTMLAEARAMAYGDPRYIGYLASASFNRGSIEYVREFNANFLALPALPGEIVEEAASDHGVVVRKIPTEGNGMYIAIINTSLESKNDVKISLPQTGDVINAATGSVIFHDTSEIIIDLYPAQLRSLQIINPTGKSPQTITVEEIASKYTDDEPFLVNATASSGLPVKWEIISGPGILSDDTVSITGPGWINLKVLQEGNEAYYPASEKIAIRVEQLRLAQTLNIEPVDDKKVGDPPFTLMVSASSGLDVAISLLEGPASLSGNNIRLSGASGTVRLYLVQRGNDQYLPVDSIIEFQVLAKTSSGPQAGEQTVRVYPNPVNDFLFIESDHKALLKIVNASGQIVQVKQLDNSASVNIAGLKPGVYNALVYSARSIYNYKLVKSSKE